MKQKPEFQISVRNLVEFILRSGDLSQGSGSRDKEAMLKGSRLHRKIQRQMKGNYQAEVSLKKVIVYEDLTLQVEGRADGIQIEADRTLIDEIKGVYLDVEKMEGPIAIHRAQAMCYAFLYAEQKELAEIWVQLTYANLETEIIQRFQEVYTFEALKQWFQELTDSYHKWISYQVKWRKERDASIEQLTFPFPYRQGQKKIVAGIYHSIIQKKQIFIQAPTGIGKTMSAIYPAVRAVGAGLGETIFYLTSKTVTRTVAEEAYAILKRQGLQFKVVTITAKDKVCFQEETVCDPEVCPYAKGHFDRVNDAVFDLWTSTRPMNLEGILEQAQKYQVCPFEMCLDTASWVDGIICDLNYVFDPDIHLKRFFGDQIKGNYLFLIDEAHNLVDRGREMYSADFYKEDVLELRKILKPFGAKKLRRSLEKVNEVMLNYKRECETYEILPHCGNLLLPMMNLMGELEAYMEENRQHELKDELLDFYFKVRAFLNISDLVDDNYVIYSEMQEDGRFKIRLFCVNPANNLKTYLSMGAGTVFFSATLLPMPYYKKLFSMEPEVFMISAESPFDTKKRALLLGRDVSSRYTRRCAQEYEKIARYLQQMVSARKGNYLAFFPSYQLMESVLETYETLFQEKSVPCICQRAGMREQERVEFLERFKEQPTETLLGFCVMGGIFSEGIDLAGEKLIGAAVIGTGIPQISREREILKNFYDQKGENGFDYAYRFPGMNKVLQAAGRVIRTSEDVGVILLLDDRFLQQEYQQIFPTEWKDYRMVTLKNVEKELMNFWNPASIS